MLLPTATYHGEPTLANRRCQPRTAMISATPATATVRNWIIQWLVGYRGSSGATWDGLRKNSPSNSYILCMGQADLGIRLIFRADFQKNARGMTVGCLPVLACPSEETPNPEFPWSPRRAAPHQFLFNKNCGDVSMYAWGNPETSKDTEHDNCKNISGYLFSLQSPWSTSWVARPANIVPPWKARLSVYIRVC